MTSVELDRICNLAASLRKDMALEGNFGMGAKVASLPSNTLGMRYRSCQNGTVSQVLLGKRDGIYGKILIQVDDDFEEIVDVTDQVREENEYSLDEDWTEVVLFGNRLDQDTVDDPYDGDPKQDGQWIATYLYHRFYRLPAGVEVFLDDEVHTRDGRRRFKPLPDRSDAFGRVETIEAADGIRLHYHHAPPYRSHNNSIKGSLTSAGSPTAIVFRGEMYDVRSSRKWLADAPAFGIPFGARHVSVHVELPDDFPVRHEPYRRFIQLADADQRQLLIEDFADLVFSHRPEWLIEIVNSFAPKPFASADDLQKELQELLNELRVRTKSPRETEGGLHLVQDGGTKGAGHERDPGSSGGGRGGKVSTTGLTFNTNGVKRANISKNLERVPEIIPLRDEQVVEDQGITGKAARYVRETNQMFVNLTYPAVDAVREDLRKRYAAYGDADIVRTLAQEWAERLVMARVGHAVVYAQAKQLVREWTSDDVDKALAPESLSLAADGWRDSVSVARRSISSRLGAAKPQSKSGEGKVSAA